ncbi:nicotinate-nucleotide--dimethylbenzimidazole phosphoribosyltransferase [Thioclava sp. BHET1]|nr:nicotinate-nucleotide--dimethylbenzimidazole phosphoribosyltransferase [Thioclava sp. BHET1]
MSDVPFTLSALADLGTLARDLPRFDDRAAEAARARQNSLSKPPGSLGRLEELAVFMAGWQGTERPKIARAQALVFAGNHGVCAQGVNPFPQEVTAQMVTNFEAGGAAINQLCRANGADLQVIALDLETPTGDITTGPALDEAACLTAFNRGAAAVDPHADVVILGEMGIGNSTIAAALAAAIFGGEVREWVGPGTGSDREGLARKIAAIERALARHADLRGNAPAQLAALGGREQAAICGAVLAARMARIPVLLDGFICTAAAAALFGADPDYLAHCRVGHVSAEPGHRRLLDALGQTPVLDFDMRLGEGSGAALALGILRSALACHNGMATFGEAGVSGG